MSTYEVLRMDHGYPFRGTNWYSHEHQILVEQIAEFLPSNKGAILGKANFLRNLKNKFLVRVNSLKEGTGAFHITYEYIENRLEAFLINCSPIFLSTIRNQLNQLALYLANIGVRILFDIDNFGLTEEKSIKFFMGIHFEWDEDPDEEYLEQFYLKQVSELLQPYVKDGNRDNFFNQNEHYGQFEVQNRKSSLSTLAFKEDHKEMVNTKVCNFGVTNAFRKRSEAETVSKFPNHQKIRKEQEIDIAQWKLSESKRQKENKEKFHNFEATEKSTKEKAEERQKKKISTVKKEYMNDFLAVLEEDPVANKRTEERGKCVSFADPLSEGYELRLKEKVNKARENSIRVLNMFKQIMKETKEI